MSGAALTDLEKSLLVALNGLVCACEGGRLEALTLSLDEARDLLDKCDPGPEPIPVGDAQDSDFGTFLDEVRK